ncbi:MAG: UDP-N-acetylmuramoyl-L-alanine--D-glutamate ligase, partial [Verrucomicrobia bacterium]
MSRKAAILGFGNSGKAAARLLNDRGWSVTVLNSSLAVADAQVRSFSDTNIPCILGAEADTDPSDYDLCVVSPGIDLKAPIVQNILRKGIPLIGEIELAFRECTLPVIAVTGTNGKTTTTGLLEILLNGCGIRARACGNIGRPFSEVVLHPPPNLQAMVV